MAFTRIEALLRPKTKASCIGQAVEGYAYAYAMREVILWKLCAKSFAAWRYIWLVSGGDWDLDDTIILPRLHRSAVFNVYSYCRSRLFSAGMTLRKRSCRRIGKC